MKIATFDNEFLDYPVSVEKNSKGQFRVVYGLQIGKWQSKIEATKELGFCLVHSMECAGTTEGGD